MTTQEKDITQLGELVTDLFARALEDAHQEGEPPDTATQRVHDAIQQQVRQAAQDTGAHLPQPPVVAFPLPAALHRAALRTLADAVSQDTPGTRARPQAVEHLVQDLAPDLAGEFTQAVWESTLPHQLNETLEDFMDQISQQVLQALPQDQAARLRAALAASGPPAGA